MAVKPWSVPSLTLPVDDAHTYTVAPLRWDDGLTLQDVLAGKSKKIKASSSDTEFFQLVLGDTWQQMLDDQQPHPVMFRAGMAAGQYQIALVNGCEPSEALALGEAIWEGGLDPEALAASLRAAVQQKRQALTPSTSTASASGTRSPASTRATTSRKATRPTKSTTARASRARTSGTRSAPTGS